MKPTVDIEFTSTTINDRNITGMYRYLQSKSIRPIHESNNVDTHIIDCLKLSNEATLQFFEMMFNSDLKRLKLIK